MKKALDTSLIIRTDKHVVQQYKTVCKDMNTTMSKEINNHMKSEIDKHNKNKKDNTL